MIFWFGDSGTLARVIITWRIADQAPLTEPEAARPELARFCQVPGGTDVAAAARPSKDLNDHCFVSTPFIPAIRGDPGWANGLGYSDRTSKVQTEASPSAQLVQSSL